MNPNFNNLLYENTDIAHQLAVAAARNGQKIVGIITIKPGNNRCIADHLELHFKGEVCCNCLRHRMMDFNLKMPVGVPCNAKYISDLT